MAFSRIKRINSEINITPFVDVVLVLLIIFMVTAPMMIAGIDVNLPKTKSQALNIDDEPLVLSIDANGVFYIQDQVIDSNDLLLKLHAMLETKKDSRILIKGDKNINYGKVVELFAIVKQIGLTNVALVTEVEQ